MFQREYAISDIDSVAIALREALSFGSHCILSGELGAGKTTLTAALVKAFGGDVPVSSPTYVLQHIYELSEGRSIEHWDLYRVGAVPDELLGPPASTVIRLIEWGEKFEELVSEAKYLVKLAIVSETARRLSFGAS